MILFQKLDYETHAETFGLDSLPFAPQAADGG